MHGPARVLAGLRVLDLTSGIAGPITTMLLADAGAEVTRVEPPGGHVDTHPSGPRVWHRDKRRLTLDLGSADVRALARDVDVVVETFAPGEAAPLGLHPEGLAEANPGVVHCSITGYGLDGPHADRPAIDGLVAARTGLQWEVRGVPGGTNARLAGAEGMLPGVEAPDGCWVGTDREGPLFSGLPWPSLATAYLATVAVSAALRARTVTGRGQHVHTSLLQGALCCTLGAWQRVEHPDAPSYQTWINDSRAPRGFFRCADGRWIHTWPMLPAFVLGAADGDELALRAGMAGTKDNPDRIGIDETEMIVAHHYVPLMAEAVARFPSDEWVALAAEVGVPVQPVRSPEEALLDPAFVADGCVAEVDDPELGPLRQVGSVYRLTAGPDDGASAPPRPAAPTGRTLDGPLGDVRVLDLGLAVAGPYGTQVLADLGAEVIKVNALHDGYWMRNHIAMSCNRGKRSVAIDLKTDQGMAILHRLVEGADVVQHNMRYDAAERLGVDYESLRAINPALVYCHTRGFETGARASLPGNDQTGAALCGSEWMDGGLDHGGRPVWSSTSLGDVGNGFLSAIAIVQALYFRDLTGEGQFVDTSIVGAHLVNNSMAWTSPDGRHVGERQRLDADQLGWHPLYRLAPTADGWLCLAVRTDAEWEALCTALDRPDLAGDPRYATAEERRANAGDLWHQLDGAFLALRASEWFERLDAAGVPCEVSDPDFITRALDDPVLQARGWVTTYEHPVVGRMDTVGLGFDLSDTPARDQGPPFVPGQHTREVLASIGYDDAAVDRLANDGVVLDWSVAARSSS